MSDTSPELVDLLERCVLAFERDGDAAVDAELSRAGAELAESARHHLTALRESGLLRAPELPDQIGPYRVLKRLGTGGMGTVFLAEQSTPIVRRVAVKLLRPGMDTHEMLARFAIEQRTLAVLDHPGIARILDAGSIADGRPYLVMDYVPGVPLVRYCDDRQLDTEERLLLFLRVCDIVQHAHHKGIVHRDLKPSNILVADRDGAPFPVVIDFGVAKSFAGQVGSLAGITLPGRLLGTPEYMSPEQAANDMDVDTRTDVYSLGVVLYELLTGALPFDSRELRRGNLADVLRDSEPATPSARIPSLGARAEPIAHARRANPGQLRRRLSGDLDWIVLRALARDRNRRYGMPAEFAADVRRHLNREPVQAGPPSSWYRFTRYCARHRLQATAAALVLGSLSAGLVTSLAFYREASASSRASSNNLDAALQAVDELVQVGDSDLVAVPHLEGMRRDLLRRAASFYRDFLAREPEAEARILPRTIDALTSLGRIQLLLGDSEAALATLGECERRLGGLTDAGISREHALELRFTTKSGLASAWNRQGQRVRAAEAAADATAAARSLREARPAQGETLTRLANALGHQASLCDHGESDRKLALLDEAFALADQALALAPADAAAIADVLDLGGNRAGLLLVLGRRGDALKAAASLCELRAKNPGAKSWPIADAMVDLAAVSWRCEDFARGREIVEGVLPELQRFAADHPSIVTYRRALVRAMSLCANCELGDRRFAEAVAANERLRTECEAALLQCPNDAGLLRQLALACGNYVACFDEWRQYGHAWQPEALQPVIDHGLALLDTLPPGDLQRDSRPDRVEMLRLRGILRASTGDHAGAAAAFAAGAELAGALVAESGDTSVQFKTRVIELRRHLADVLLTLGRSAEAQPIVAAVVADSAAIRDTVSQRDRWQSRHRELLLLQARVCGAAGDLDGMGAALQAHASFGTELDWIGRMDQASALTKLVAALPPAAPQRAAVRERARAALAEARDFIAQNRGKGTGHGTLLVMSYRTEGLALDLEHGFGDRAATVAAGDLYAATGIELWQTTPNDRNARRAVDATGRWLDAIAEAGDREALTPAVARTATAFASQAALLADLAAGCARDHGSPAVQALGDEAALGLLRAALTAGLPASELAAERFARLQRDERFRELSAANGKRGG